MNVEYRTISGIGMADENSGFLAPLSKKYPGVFISFEGGEGVGKTTQITILADFLTEHGYEVVVTKEPGGTKLGKVLREALLNEKGEGETVLDPRTEAILYAADRSHHVHSLILPALRAGKIVISDRYIDSSLAYQGAARSLGVDEIRTLSLWATQGLLPNVTFLLHADPQVGFSRRANTPIDRLEKEPLSFHNEVNRMFMELAAADPGRFKVLDACANIELIATQIQEKLVKLLPDIESQKFAPSRLNAVDEVAANDCRAKIGEAGA